MILRLNQKISVIATILLLTNSVIKADELSGHINGYIALKTLDSGDWPNDLDKHLSMGIFFDIKRESWPVSIALDVLDTGGKNKHDGMEDLGHTAEIHLGIRKIYENLHAKIQPYFGGGISGFYAEQEFEENNITTTEDDRGVGGWLGAGLYYEINPKFVFGLDARYSSGEVTVFNKDISAGGLHSGLTIGYQF